MIIIIVYFLIYFFPICTVKVIKVLCYFQAAQTLLKDASVGAFVIRDSGDRKFIFSLSVQTERGPTSVRLHFEDGYFRYDSFPCFNK